MNNITPSSTLSSYTKHKWEVNVTPLERFGRVLIGMIGIVGGAVLLTSSATLFTRGFDLLLILTGLELVVTGVNGHSPLYKKLDHVHKTLRR